MKFLGNTEKVAYNLYYLYYILLIFIRPFRFMERLSWSVYLENFVQFVYKCKFIIPHIYQVSIIVDAGLTVQYAI